MATKDSASPDEIERAIGFVAGQLDRYGSYHRHKESMAFTGLTLFAGTAGASLVSSAWPPWWGEHTRLLAIAAFTALWIGVLAYLRFQLRHRRWAALRVAGCERVLTQWIQSPPTHMDLEPRHRVPIGDCLCLRWVDFVWPQKAAVRAVGPGSDDESVPYPSILVDAWVNQEERGTASLTHERLIMIAGWVLYIVAAVHTWFAT